MWTRQTAVISCDVYVSKIFKKTHHIIFKVLALTVGVNCVQNTSCEHVESFANLVQDGCHS